MSHVTRAQSARRAPTGALSAHFAWAGAACVGVAVDAAVSGPALAHAGLLAAALLGPLLAACIAGRLRRPQMRGLLLFVWAAAAASVLALGGPIFAAWAFAPLAAALAIGPRDALWEGAGLALAAFAAGLGGWALGGTGAAGAAIWAAALTTAGMGVFVAFAAAAALRRAETEARAATSREERAHALLEASPVVFLRVGFDAKIQDAAGPARALLRVAERSLPGSSVTVVADADCREALERAVSRSLRFGDTGELTITAAGRPVRVTVTPNGGYGVVVTAREDDDLERLAKAHAERDAVMARMEARSRFFAGMSHELRTPLNAILGFSETIRGRMFGPISAKYGEYVDIIHESAMHLLELINSILDLSKMDAGRYEIYSERLDAVEIAQAAARLTASLAEKKSIDLRVESSADSVPVLADGKALKQILLNLISNAVKFTPEKGDVIVAVRAESGALVLEVADTGCGMSADEVAAIGQPYMQGEGGKLTSQGTGLGLAIVRGFAELHGGGVEVESAPDQGTTMRVRLPVLAGPDAGGEDARVRLKRLDDDVSAGAWPRSSAGGEA